MRFFSYYKDKNIVNLSNSILKRYGVDLFHESLTEIDEILQKHRKIALFLFDGFGKSISERHLSEDSFLMKNKFTTISSTFPPTTVAATNAMKSGRYPAETGWLAWSFLDRVNNRAIEYFTHKNYDTKELIEDFDFSQFAYESIFELIRKNNKDVAVFENYPKGISDGPVDGFENMDQMLEKVSDVLKNNDDALIYSYYLEPDHSLHRLGTENGKIHEICSEINEKIEKFAKENPDTLILVYADHSHIDVSPIFFADLKELHECVTTIYAIEARCASFDVKEGKKEKFLEFYKNNLEPYYDILTKEEAIEMSLFGMTKSAEWVEKHVGDYLLIAVGKSSLENFKLDPMIATHGGGTKEENLINLFIINK